MLVPFVWFEELRESTDFGTLFVPKKEAEGNRALSSSGVKPALAKACLGGCGGGLGGSVGQRANWGLVGLIGERGFIGGLVANLGFIGVDWGLTWVDAGVTGNERT